MNQLRISLIIIFCPLLLFAQQTIHQESPEPLYDQAMLMMESGNYRAAVRTWEKYLQNPNALRTTEARYYESLGRMKSGDPEGIAAVTRFATSEKNHPLAAKGFFEVGTYFFQEKKYLETVENLTRTRPSLLGVADQEALYFRLGYAQYQTADSAAAISSLEKVMEYRGAHYIPAGYYLGQLYLEQQDYLKALTVLEDVQQRESEYQADIRELLAKTLYVQRNFSGLYAFGQQHLSETTASLNRTLNRLMGEAYFEEKKYDRAAVHLQRYLDLARRMDAEGYFRLAFAYFQLGENQKAIDQFKLAALEKGELGQSSSFYLGQLYLRTGNLSFAQSAFQTANSTGSDEVVKEESAFLLGKISYERQQFADAIQQFSVFLQKYDQSRWKGEANEWLAQSYLKTSNYDQAIAHLEGISNKTTTMQRAYQRVTFQKGQLQFNDGRFADAVTNLRKSLEYPQDRNLAAQTHLLLGESFALLEKTEDARRAYERARQMQEGPWSVQAAYGLGYLHYNTREYASAEQAFVSFVQRAPANHAFLPDARLRLADCQFVQKKYDVSIRGYQDLLGVRSLAQDYLYYQLALAHGLKGDNNQAVRNFQRVIDQENATYRYQAMFQMGQLLMESSEYERAIAPFSQLVSEASGSPLIAHAYSKRALCYFNLQQYPKARADYEYILQHYLTHPAANSALLGLQEVSKKGETVADFEQYMEAYRQANPDDSSLEVVTFEAAKSRYYDQKYAEAIDRLMAFLERYPSSAYREDAWYLLADARYRLQRWADAVVALDELLKSANTVYLGRALDRRGKALLQLKNYEEAAQNYHWLKRNSQNPKDLFAAHEGLMLTWYQAGNADSALVYANVILSESWKPVNAELNVWLMKGRIYLARQEYERSMDELLQVVNASRVESGAEARYLMARIYYEQGNHRRSLETLFDLNRNFGSYPHWIGQSFLLIADNYLALNELLQAEATLQSIITNAQQPEVRQEAEQKLLQVRQKESQVLETPNDTLR